MVTRTYGRPADSGDQIKELRKDLIYWRVVGKPAQWTVRRDFLRDKIMDQHPRVFVVNSNDVNIRRDDNRQPKRICIELAMPVSSLQHRKPHNSS
jgi:hypothetical protein